MITVTQSYGGNFIVPPVIPNLRRQGVPPGGPADPILARLVSELAQNQTVLELTAPITLVTDCLTQIAIAAPRNSACIPDHPTMCLGLISASPSTSLTIHAPKTGFRVYLSWTGLDSPTLLPTPISTGQSLASSHNHFSSSVILDPVLIPPPTETIRYLYIIENATQIHCQTTPAISRIGNRLSFDILDSNEIPPQTASAKTSPHLFRNLAPNTRSEPSTHGTIQVTPDNQLLIHGPDGPTLGGYPKIGTIIEADLPSLAQLRPGQQIELIPVSLEVALDLRRESALQLQKTLHQINQALRIAHNST